MELKQRQFVSSILPCLLYLVLHQFTVDYNAWEECVILSNIAKKRQKKSRIPWSSVDARISDKQFRRMFRMTRDCFSLLCQDITMAIGESQFKSESYINTFLNKKGSVYHAHRISSGGVISGETKLAITLRLLACLLYTSPSPRDS